MNEKERIIELVKQNVITMDEALRLLEASAQQSTEKQVVPEKATIDTEQIKQSVQQVVDSSAEFGKEVWQDVQQKVDPIVKEVKAEWQQSKESYQANKELKQQLKEKQEALVIAKQRLREYEVLEELGEGSEEFTAQAQEIKAEVAQLEADINALNAELKEEVNLDETADKVFQRLNEASQSVSESAGTFGRLLGKALQGVAKVTRDGLKSGKWKWEYSVDFSRRQLVPHSYRLDAQQVRQFNLVTNGGDIQVKTHDEADIVVDARLKFAEHAEATVEKFEQFARVGVEGDTFYLQTEEDEVDADIVLYLPAQQFKALSVQTDNGEIELEAVQFEQLKVASSNTDADLTNVKADFAEFEILNGDIVARDCVFGSVVIDGTNVDVRLQGELADVVVNTVSGDILITKENNSRSAMKLSTVSGDIKVAIPETLSLLGEATTTSGDILHRIEVLDVETRRPNSLTFQRHLGENVDMVTLVATTVSGDIRFKDAE